MVSTETLYAQLRDAVFDNDKERLQELLQHDGVDVDHLDAGGQTLLHLACFWGRMELVKVLLNAGASLKAKNAAACTALDLATHWGHSAVAEVIRLRGGRSVWEEKLGHLQVQVEDLKLQAQESQTQYLDKKRAFDTLTIDYHSLHTRFEEAKSARLLSEHALAQARLDVESLTADNARLQTALDDMTANYHATLIEKAKAEHLQHEAQRETTAVIAHRDGILRTMQESVAKQEAAAHSWQRAEVAAAIADSQRNFAFAERDQFQKKHVAALADLVVVTAKLDAAEEELMVLKTDLAEHIYEKKREQKIKKRAARALSHVYGDSGCNETGVNAPSGANRPLTTPVNALQQKRALSPPAHHRPELRASTAAVGPTPASSGPSSPLPATSNKPATTAAKKKYFSLAAREYGERLRAEELKKQKERAKRHARTENQYLTQGLSAPVRAAEQFQDEFVATVQSFTTARSAKWKELKKERDRQAWFTRSVLARPIATAPHALGRVASSPLESTGESDSIDGSASADATDSNRSMRFSIYEKYARPAYVDNPLRPVTSPLEVRMQQAFFAAPATRTDRGDPDECLSPGADEDREDDDKDAGAEPRRSEHHQQPEDARFLPSVR